jgi:hypothetical protein
MVTISVACLIMVTITGGLKMMRWQSVVTIGLMSLLWGSAWAETPKAEAPKVEAPKAETPKTETPKASESIWAKKTYEKEIYAIGQKLLKANGIQEHIAFRLDKRTSEVNASADDDWANVVVNAALLARIFHRNVRVGSI